MRHPAPPSLFITTLFLAACQITTLPSAVQPPPGIPQEPVDLRAQTLSGGRIQLMWENTPQAEFYMVFRRFADCQSGEQLLADRLASTRLLDRIQDGRWCYVVHAVSRFGISPPSFVLASSDSQPPPPVDAIFVEPAPLGAIVHWQPGPGELPASYRISRDGVFLAETTDQHLEDNAGPGLHIWAVSTVDPYGNVGPSEFIEHLVDFTAPVGDLPLNSDPPQWILWTEDADCPVPLIDTWSTERLFEGAEADSVLSGYCVYETLEVVQGQQGPTFEPSLGAPVPTPAHPRVTPQAAPWIVDVQRQQADAFAARAGALALPVQSSATASLVVLDTSPDGTNSEWSARLPNEERSPHGYQQLRLAQHLGCPGDSCIADVSSVLAMPRVNTPGGVVKDLLLGGTFGTLPDLAAAIVLAVDTSAGPVVLDLPLAWPPSYGADPLSSPPVDAAAVFDALAYARCSGAIIFAAVGNDSGGSIDYTGAMLPAAWADQELDLSTCATVWGVLPPPPEDSCTNCDVPLLYAVGGLHAHDDTEIAIARPDSTPRFVAIGDHGTAPTGPASVWGTATSTTPPPGWMPNPLQRPELLLASRTDGPLTPATGTSVATTVVSSAAAVVRAMQPGLTPVEVADLLASSGVPTTLSLNVAGGLTTQTFAHRVSVCRAVAGALGTSPICNDGPQPPPSVDLTSLPVIPVTPVAGGFFAVCDHDAFGPTVPAEPCPLRQYYTESLQALTIPQNPVNSCESCGLLDNNQVVVGEAIDAEGESVMAAALVLEKTDGSAVSYELAPSMVRGPSKVLECPTCDFTNIQAARIDLKVQTPTGVKARSMPLYRAVP